MTVIVKKNLACYIVVLILICSIIPNIAHADDAGEFDYVAVLGAKDGYKYDRFEKQWSWLVSYKQTYSDAVVQISFQTLGIPGESNIEETDLFCRILDYSGKQLYSVESIDILVGDVMYSYNEMDQNDAGSGVIIGKRGRLLIEDLAFCDPSAVSVRLIFDNKSLTFDLDSNQFQRTLQDFCITYLINDMWKYSGQNATRISTFEVFHPLRVDGEIADYEKMHIDRDLSTLELSQVDDAATMGEKNALKKAKAYLSTMAFSRDGLIKQLEYSGFTHNEAVYGADHVDADWNEQAVKKAKAYLSTMAFSRDGLIKQLEYSGFTHDEAVYGADHVDTDGNEQVVKKAKAYLSTMAFSRDGLIKQLEYSGFAHDEAVYGADHVDVDWNEQAVKKAKAYLSTMAFSRDGLIKQLEYSGFTHDEAVYGADHVDVDWNEQAVKKAKAYLSTMAFSKESLINQLIYSGFTQEQAEYAVVQVGF